MFGLVFIVLSFVMLCYFFHDIFLIWWFWRLGSLSNVCFKKCFLWIALICVSNVLVWVKIRLHISHFYASQICEYGLNFSLWKWNYHGHIYICDYWLLSIVCRLLLLPVGGTITPINLIVDMFFYQSCPGLSE